MELIEHVWACYECGKVGGAGTSLLEAKNEARRSGWPSTKQPGKPSELSLYCADCRAKQRRRAQGERA